MMVVGLKKGRTASTALLNARGTTWNPNNNNNKDSNVNYHDNYDNENKWLRGTWLGLYGRV